MNSSTSSLDSVMNSVHTSSTPIWSVFGVGATVILLSCILLRGTTDGKVHDLGGLSLWNTWSFFTKRYDYLHYHLSRRGIFRFRFFKHRVIALSGVEGRKAIFNQKPFDVRTAYEIIQGKGEISEDILADGSQTMDRIRRVVVGAERLKIGMPLALKDLDRMFHAWGSKGSLNLFQDADAMIFQMSLRMIVCNSLCDDPDAMSNFSELFWVSAASPSFFDVAFPWLTSYKQKKENATKNICLLLLKYIAQRRETGAKGTEPFDLLIHEDCTDAQIIEFVMITMALAITSSGFNIAWIVAYLSYHPEWKASAKKELEDMISKYTDPSSRSPFHAQLSSISLSAWESELPVIDNIIRETLRLIFGRPVFRANLGQDIVLNGVRVKRNELVAYNAGDIHWNPDVYPDPFKFDPGRHAKGREEGKDTPLGFVGWGAGRHPCLGTRFAKLETKWILAFLLVGHDYTLVDKSGNPAQCLPHLDSNKVATRESIRDPLFLKLVRVRD